MVKLSSFKRIVIKIGSALLVDQKTGAIRRDWLLSLADDIAWLRGQGLDVIVVSSGAIALGRQVLNLPDGPLKLEESQAAASVGQISLAPAWEEALSRHAITTGQVLLTLADTEERRRYLNARATVGTLLKLEAVPIINENDTVATIEIRYGDNDRLAARVATMTGADGLVLLSDVDGLYDAPPATHPNANHLPHVAEITPEIEAMAGAAGTAYASGGMTTKLEAAKIAVASGTAMLIASGRTLNPLKAIDEGARCTLFEAHKTPLDAREKYIAGHLDPHGKLVLDAGAVNALRAGKSLLPAGVTAIEGAFERGDTVSIMSPDNIEIARGLVAYDDQEASQILGCQSRDIEGVLGYPGRSVMVHCDDLVLKR